MLLASLLAAGGTAGAQQRAGSRLQPNVLLITLDDVGTDKLAMYGESDAPQYAQAPYCGILAHPLPYAPTPSLDRLAAGSFPGLLGGGIRFDRAYAAPVCCMTRGALNTGRYGLRNGLGVVDDGNPYRKRMKNSEVLLSELLRKGFAPATAPGAPRRYRCGAFGKWHMTGLPVCDPVRTSDFSHPILNGFHVFKGTMGNPGVAVSNPGDHYNWTQVISTPSSVELLRREVGASAFVGPFQFSAACTAPGTLVRTTSFSPEAFTASVTRADAVEWINAQPSAQPFFAYVNFHAPHFPYQLPPFELLSPATRAALQNPANCGGPYCPGQESGTGSPCGTGSCGDLSGCPSTQMRLFYAAMLEAVDTEIGNLLAQIEPVKRANTLVLVVSDNGTPGAVIEPLLHDVGRGKGTMYESGVRVPLLVAGPIVPRGAHATQALVHVVDVWRTLADVTGASETRAAPLQPLDSISFRNQLVRPGSPSARTEVFTQGFALPGGYQPTEAGPYELGCQDPTTPGVFVWAPQNTGDHGRSLCDGRHKLIVIQTAPGQDSLPAGTPDTLPQYREELYDLLLDPEETNDLAPQVGTDPGITAIRDQLRARITQISGF